MGVPIERSFKIMGTDSLSDSDFGQLLASFRTKHKALSATIKRFDGSPEPLDAVKRGNLKIGVAPVRPLKWHVIF